MIYKTICFRVTSVSQVKLIFPVYRYIPYCRKVRILPPRPYNVHENGMRTEKVRIPFFFLPLKMVNAMTFSSLIGIVAASLTSIAFVPQVWRVIRTRDTRAISLWMYLLFSTGVLLWLVYGVVLMLWPVIIANGVTLLLSLVVIFFKIREPRCPQES